VRRDPLLVIASALILTGAVFAYTGYADLAGAALWMLAGAFCALLANGRPC